MSQEYTSGNGSQKRSDELFEQLVGMAQMAVADGKVTRQEAKIIHNFLQIASKDPKPIFTKLLQRTSSFFEDGILDDVEAQELLYLLENIAKTDGVTKILGEPPSELLNEPTAAITIGNRSFCFLGVFSFGTKKECEAITQARGGSVGFLNEETDFVVLGSYVTGAFRRETFSREIKDAKVFFSKYDSFYCKSIF